MSRDTPGANMQTVPPGQNCWMARVRYNREQGSLSSLIYTRGMIDVRSMPRSIHNNCNFHLRVGLVTVTVTLLWKTVSLFKTLFL